MADALELYLFRIEDRPYGFRAVAIVSDDPASLADMLASKFCAQTESWTKRNYAELMGSCPVEPGRYVDLEYEE